jgi:hypothetical protein
MYSGGHAFFDMLKKDSRFTQQNQSAYFLLESGDWQVFGLDSAFDPRDFRGSSGGLYGEQAAWVARLRAASPSKKRLVLTHHQPFSAYEPASERLERQLRPVHAAGQIDAWFWGHKHLCAVYQPYANVRFPVLLGHGGFPERAKAKRAGAPTVNYEWLVKRQMGFSTFRIRSSRFQRSENRCKLVDEDGTVRHAFPIA